MFITSDIYTVNSTALKLLNCWTDKVTKFDSSAFYNWEQDNLPVYDLEERTYLLWEKMGFPTSSVPGVALAVSADAPDSAIGCNKNIFRSVSAAVASLPEMINFPILIEVANFGGMGELVLNNFKFGPRGSLEIINRNFASQDSEVSGVWTAGLFTNAPVRVGMSTGFPNGGTNPYNYLSTVFTNYSLLNSANLTYIFPTKIHFRDSSCLSISAPVFSGHSPGVRVQDVEDSRLSSTLNGFVAAAHDANCFTTTALDTISYNSRYSKSNLIIASNNNLSLYDPDYHDWMNFKSYDLNPDATQNISTYDVSTFDYLNSNNHLYLKTDNTYATLYNGLFYGNRLDKIVVNNCEGPIFIRNFFVDGSGYSRTNNNFGVEVNNSKQVYLENIVSTRHRKAGFVFNNSNVYLLRNCVATRNYDYDSSNNRKTGVWSTKNYYNSFSNSNYLTNIDLGAGVLANNSTITVSSVRKFQEIIQNAHVYEKQISYGVTSTGVYPYLPLVNKNCIFEFSKNANGIILNNSVLQGGEICKNDFGLDNNSNTINIDIMNNSQYGLLSNNSKISFDGKLAFIENLIGAKLDSSVFEIDKSIFIYNQKVGLEANQSNIVYNKNLIDYLNDSVSYQSVHFEKNGQHIILNSSNLLPAMTSGMDSIYSEFFTLNPFGIKNPTNATKEIIPGIEIINGSEAVIVSPNFVREFAYSTDPNLDAACKGSEISVTNNSKARLIGTRNRATRVIGPQGRIYQKNLAATYAGNNSTLEFNGPTLIALFGIDILGENNSTINITPQRLNGENTLDVSSFNLSNKLNHTAVELHSTRACVVVDKNSIFNAKDLGSFARTWDVTGSFYSDRAGSGIDYGDLTYIEPYVSAGSLQFYPNPIAVTAYPGYDSDFFPGAGSATIAYQNFSLASDTSSLYYFKNRNSTSNSYSSITNGGYCVRALNGSLVNIHNVNFPCGWWNCSAPYYDNSISVADGGLCYKTFIWNIADTSQLKASFLSVSGRYPTTAGYVGPSGMWASGATGVIASGLPNSTPDTSSASVLDYFGAAPVSANPFGKTIAQNYGPFRLYFSINPAANVLTDISSTTYHIIPQLYSQGYQPSASLVGSAFDASTLHRSILQRNSSNVIVASGYYYGSGMTDTNGYTRILLDESAANVFANAKHCSVGKSGNSKLVSIYYPYTETPIGSSYTQTGIKSPNTFDLQRDN